MRTTDVLERLSVITARRLYYWVTIGAIAPEEGRAEEARQGVAIDWSDLDLARLEAIDDFLAAMDPVTHRIVSTDAIRVIWRVLERNRSVDLGPASESIRLVVTRRAVEGEQ